MTRNSFTILFFILSLSVFNVPSKAFAQDASGTPKQINARILPLVWYSTLSINEGDSIKIYSGIQNNSGIDFTGTATFYVDDKEISQTPFSSSDNSLKDVSTNWKADYGSHSVQVKVTTSLPSDKILVSSASDKSNISIIKMVTPITKADVEAAVLNTASSIVSNTNNLANALADKIESLKTPIVPDAPSISSGVVKGALTKIVPVKEKSAVLGASTGPTVKSTAESNSPMDFVYNFFLGILAFLVRNWKWSLIGIIGLFLLFKIISWRKG